MAIKIALDEIDKPEFRNINNYTIFSDSQTAVGILTLNWKSEGYRQTIYEIKRKLTTLQNNGIEINLEWTPGHASIEGNETADKLAKEAAKEASDIDDISFITKQDIKKASRDSVMEKWQKRWENSERGRQYFKFHKDVKFKTRKDEPSKKHFSIFTGLRSGFIPLNKYKFQLNQSDSPNCDCGEEETVEHYLLHCGKYDTTREKLRHDMYFITGSLQLDLETLLIQDEDDPFKQQRQHILTCLSDFCDSSNRF